MIDPGMIDRREAIARVVVMLGGVTLVGGTELLAAVERSPARTPERVRDFTADDIAFLDEIAETILPATTTPGAKAAKTGAFMALMVTDAYSADDQKRFRDGMRALDERCRKLHGTDFMTATPAQRLALLKQVDREQKAYMDARDVKRRTRDIEAAGAKVVQADAAAGVQALGPDAIVQISADSPAHYFRMMKELALLGYFTSEIGCKQALRYEETPGSYEPCVPYKPGERAWAAHA